MPRLHPLVVALVEAYARELRLPPAELWDYLERRKAPPDELRRQLVEAFFPRVRPDDFLLPSGTENDTVNTVNASPSSNALRSRARISDESRKHKFVRIIARKGVTFAEVAVALSEKLGRKVPRSTVQAWPKKPGDPSYRAIPEDAAEALRELYGVPMNCWARVIAAI